MATCYRFLLAVILTSSVAFPQADCVFTNVIRCFPGDTVFTNTVILGTNTYYKRDSVNDTSWDEDYSEIFQLSLVQTNLPAGLVHATLYGKHDPDITNDIAPECGSMRVVSDWDMYCITGMVSQAAVNTQTIFHIHRQQLVSNEVVDEVHVCHLIQVDDYSDSKDDTNHLGNIPVSMDISNWPEGISNVYGECFKPIRSNQHSRTEQGDIEDIDCFKLTLNDQDVISAGVYCIQGYSYGNRMTIQVSADPNNAITGTQFQLAFTSPPYEETDCQRSYFTLTTNARVFVSVSFYTNTWYPLDLRSYTLAALPVTPVVLVHGVVNHPTLPTDYLSSFPLRSQGPYNPTLPPCSFLDFPWDCTKEDPRSESAHLEDYLLLNLSTYNTKCVLLAHSVGGFIAQRMLVYATNENPRIGAVVYATVPFYGTDINTLLVKNDAWRSTITKLCASMPGFWNVNVAFWDELEVGSDYVLAMQTEPLGLPTNRIFCVVGTDNTMTFQPQLPLILAGFCGEKDVYNVAVGVVGVSKVGTAIKTATLLTSLPAIKDALDGLASAENIIGYTQNDLYRTLYVGLAESDGYVPVSSQNLLSRPDYNFATNVFFGAETHLGVIDKGYPIRTSTVLLDALREAIKTAGK